MKLRLNRYTLIIIRVLLIFSGFVLLNKSLSAQEAITVDGVITDNNNSPLAGVTIRIEGTSSGTISDLNGHFRIACANGDVVAVSYIGYKTQTFTISSATSLTIIMEEDYIALSEAVVVGIGYGTMRKSDLTGAITSVSSGDMKKGIITSSEQLLQGKVAGLTVIQGSGDPASGASLRLRGGTSLSAGNSPLIVVDGIPGADFNTVQPSEIVSIDVLKDASAAAIYGSRGANGVIIVTTNRANKGKEMRYQTYLAIGTVANHIDMLSANQWRQYVRNDTVLSAIDFGGNTDWQRELEQVSVSQVHNISFSSATENNGFRASMTYLNNEGVIKSTKLERIGISISDYQYGMDERLKLEVGLNANMDKWNPLDTRIFERTMNLNPTIPVYNPDGSFTRIGGTKYDNPVEINTNRFADNTRHRLLGFGKAELEIIKGLKAIVNLSYEYNSMQSRLYKPTNAVMEGTDDKGFGQRTLGDYSTRQLETFITYEKQFSTNHKINLLGGYSYLDNTYEGFGALRRGFDTDIFLYNNLGAGMDYRTGDVYSYKGQAKLISFFGRANYNYQGKYMATATLRRDGSSRFGANHKWGLFPSASIAWRISDESFMQWADSWLDNLKVRAGYGITGNQDGIGEYKSLSLLGAGTKTYYDNATQTWKQSYGPIQNPNPDLKWESTEQTNIGIDFSVIGRIKGTLEVYQKNTSDLLYTYAVSSTQFDYPWILANVGDLSNKGIEMSLSANLINNKELSWDVYVLFAKNRQVIERLSNEYYSSDSIPTGSLHGLTGMSGQYSQIIKEGYAVGTFVGPIYTGLDSAGLFIFQDSGMVKVIGDVQPKFSFGFGTSLFYKNFDFEISAYGMLGQKILNATAMELNNPKRLPALNVPDTYLSSKITSPMTYSSYWIEDASFLRIQSISLGYTLYGKMLGIEKLRVYITGENLFVFTKYTGVDPEVSIEGLEKPGMDWFNAYPRPRTFSFGINISF